MRDIIWTIITIWVVWKIIDAFRGFSKTRQSHTRVYNNPVNSNNAGQSIDKISEKKGNLKPDAGEYVDYEEIK